MSTAFFALGIIGIGFLALLLWVLQPFVVVRHDEAVMLERWGKQSAVLLQGFHWLVPLMHGLRSVDWRNEKDTVQGFRLPLGQRVHQFVVEGCALPDDTTADLQITLQYKIKDVRVAAYVPDLFESMELAVENATDQMTAGLSAQELATHRLGESLRGFLQNSDEWKALGLGLQSVTARLVRGDNAPQQQQQDARLQGHLAETRRWAELQLELHAKELQMLQTSGHSDAVICAYLQRADAASLTLTESATQSS